VSSLEFCPRRSCLTWQILSRQMRHYSINKSYYWTIDSILGSWTLSFDSPSEFILHHTTMNIAMRHVAQLASNRWMETRRWVQAYRRWNTFDRNRIAVYVWTMIWRVIGKIGVLWKNERALDYSYGIIKLWTAYMRRRPCWLLMCIRCCTYRR
jgi:hypothetical protein